MRKMFLLFGMLAMVGILFVACTEQQATGPEEASFKKVSNNCTGDDLFNKNLVEAKINEVLADRQSKKGAKQILDNIARKVCADQSDATPSMVEGFYELLVDQPVDEIVGGWEAAVELLAMVAEFATGTEFGGGFPIPPEALGEDGGFGIVIPGAAKTITANSGEAALVADATSFPGITEPVAIAFYRIPDPVPGVPDYPIPGYQAYPEAWDFSGSAQPTGGVDFWMCVVDDVDHPLPVGVWDRLQVGHERGELPPELLPRMVDLDGQFVDCAGAGPYQAPPAPPGGIDVTSAVPTWLRLAGGLLKPVAERFLDVEPLNAMYFAGKGLGGRGTSFSDFVGVDPASYSEALTGVEPAQATIEFSQSLQLQAATNVPGVYLPNSVLIWSVGEIERLIEITDEGIVTGVGVAVGGPSTSDATVSYGDDSAVARITVTDLACYPDLPDPVLVLDRVETRNGLDYYYLTVTNSSAFPDALFWMTNYYGACGLNDTPSRSWVDIYEALGLDVDPKVYGFCGLESAAGMQSLWFALDAGAQPEDVYIGIEDRACGNTYESNTVYLAGSF